MKTFNKLVRDKIKDIIEENGEVANIKYLSDYEYIKELNKKLQEEVAEYLASGDIEELADIEEVILAIIDYKKVTREHFENVRKEKVVKRGAFKERMFLISTEEK